MKPFDTIKSEKVYTGKVFEIVKDTVLMPTGKESVYDLVRHNGASAIIAVHKGKLIFVRQNRHAANANTLEIPAGTLEKGEDPKECAIRELEEETGYSTKDVEFLFKGYSAIGISNEVLYFYLAENLSQGTQNLDENEFVEIEAYTLEEAVNMIFEGKIIDNKTISGILMYKALLEKRS